MNDNDVIMVLGTLHSLAEKGSIEIRGLPRLTEEGQATLAKLKEEDYHVAEKDIMAVMQYLRQQPGVFVSPARLRGGENVSSTRQ